MTDKPIDTLLLERIATEIARVGTHGGDMRRKVFLQLMHDCFKAIQQNGEHPLLDRDEIPTGRIISETTGKGRWACGGPCRNHTKREQARQCSEYHRLQHEFKLKGRIFSADGT